ncbi:MAG: penicillin-binding transpeptidase domain-containing protein [Actinomycetota bacterium]|nr:penicillin-binding transpeptidase domain-containing protein [Actinomycetota bacterium]
MVKGPRKRKIGTRPISPKKKPKPRSNATGGVAAPPKTFGLDRLRLRLLVFGVLLFTVFVALFSRLWFLQVLAADQYEVLARENRVRRVDSEPPRGRILDRNGVVLVDNRPTLSVTIDRQIITQEQVPRVLRRLSKLLKVKVKDLRENLNDGTVSPYKPVPVASDITEQQAIMIDAYSELYPGVSVEELQVRTYPQRKLLAHVLGYVGEVNSDELKSGPFKSYKAGDIIGKAGIERTYDPFLRGEPRIENVVVDANNEVVGERVRQLEEEGDDLYLSIDVRIQKLVEKALEDGIMTARGSGFPAPDGGAVILDPKTGDVVAMASYPTYNPSILADGYSNKDARVLAGSPDTNQDDALTNRAIASEQAPGSTFKPITAGAALSLGVIGAYDGLDCPGTKVYPPDGRPGSQVYSNWTSADSGYVSIPTSLEISCNTFYYELGWRMEDQWGKSNGDETERYQRYQRTAGFGNPTGIDLPYEQDGVVPDWNWCEENEDIGYCPDGWLPGYTVNMSIGQGDLKVTPLQMATSYSALVNGGIVWEPRVGFDVRRPPIQNQDELEESQSSDLNDLGETSVTDPAATEAPVDEGAARDTEKVDPDDSKVVKDIKAKKSAELPLDETQLGVIRDGLELVVSGASGTATGVFSGFPLDQFPVAGKTGTAQRGETGQNDSWFVSYGPADDPGYVMAVYVEEADHGGTTSAPIARQIWEGIAALEGIGGVDRNTDVSLGSDGSG